MKNSVFGRLFVRVVCSKVNFVDELKLILGVV